MKLTKTHYIIGAVVIGIATVGIIGYKKGWFKKKEDVAPEVKPQGVLDIEKKIPELNELYKNYLNWQKTTITNAQMGQAKGVNESNLKKLAIEMNQNLQKLGYTLKEDLGVYTVVKK